MAKGKHVIKIDSETGENAIRYFAFMPSQDFSRALTYLNRILDQRGVVYFSEFSNEVHQMTLGVEASQGKAIALNRIPVEIGSVLRNSTLAELHLANMYGTRWPRGDSYYVDEKNGTIRVIERFHLEGSADETFILSYVPSSINASRYLCLEYKTKVDDPLVQFFYPMITIDINGDNKDDAWLRFYPETYSSRKGEIVIHRTDGIKDVWIPLSAPQTYFTGQNIEVGKKIETLFRGVTSYKITGRYLRFDKMPNWDFSSSPGNYTFYVKDFNLVERIPAKGTILSKVPVSNFTLPKSIIPGSYEVSIRVSGPNQTSMMTASIGALNSTVQVDSSSFEWYNIGRTYLWSDNTTISLRSDTNTIYLDQLFLFKQWSNASVSAPQISFSKINDAKYLIRSNASQPLIIVFSETYDKNWVIRFKDGSIVNSLPDYSELNFFMINKTGPLEMLLEYKKETAHMLSYSITMLTNIIVLTALIIPTSFYMKVNITFDRLRRSLHHKRDTTALI